MSCRRNVSCANIAPNYTEYSIVYEYGQCDNIIGIKYRAYCSPICIEKASSASAVLFSLHKKGSGMFYEEKRWRNKRTQILRRDKYLCQQCKRYGRLKPAVVVHHILHLEDRPDLAFDSANLVSLCLECHNKAHPEKGHKAKTPPSSSEEN